MTKKQGAMQMAIWIHWRAHGCGPTVAELQEALGMKHPHAVQVMLDAMEKKGLIEREPLKSRHLWPAGFRAAIRELVENIIRED